MLTTFNIQAPGDLGIFTEANTLDVVETMDCFKISASSYSESILTTLGLWKLCPEISAHNQRIIINNTRIVTNIIIRRIPILTNSDRSEVVIEHGLIIVILGNTCFLHIILIM